MWRSECRCGAGRHLSQTPTVPRQHCSSLNKSVLSFLHMLTTCTSNCQLPTTLLCAVQQSIDISCQPSPEQQTCSTGFAAVGRNPTTPNFYDWMHLCHLVPKNFQENRLNYRRLLVFPGIVNTLQYHTTSGRFPNTSGHSTEWVPTTWQLTRIILSRPPVASQRSVGCQSILKAGP